MHPKEITKKFITKRVNKVIMMRKLKVNNLNNWKRKEKNRAKKNKLKIHKNKKLRKRSKKSSLNRTLLLKIREKLTRETKINKKKYQ